MAWSYSAADLSNTTSSGRLNTVRLLVGDTDTTDQQVQNEEINFSLAENNDNTYLSASWIARVISSKYARLVTTKLDGALSSNYSDLDQQSNLHRQGQQQDQGQGQYTYEYPYEVRHQWADQQKS